MRAFDLFCNIVLSNHDKDTLYAPPYCAEIMSMQGVLGPYMIVRMPSLQTGIEIVKRATVRVFARRDRCRSTMRRIEWLRPLICTTWQYVISKPLCLV